MNGNGSDFISTVDTSMLILACCNMCDLAAYIDSTLLSLDSQNLRTNTKLADHSAARTFGISVSNPVVVIDSLFVSFFCLRF